LITFTKNCLKNGFCFVKITVRNFWCYRVIHDLSRQQEFNKTQSGKRQLNTGSAAALLWGRFNYIKQSKKTNEAKEHPPDRIKKKKLKKEHYTGGQGVSPTPSTWQAEGIFPWDVRIGLLF
jgi:hypothetical protein